MSTALIITFFAVAAALSAIGGVLAAVDTALSVSSRADLEQLAENYPKKSAAIRAISHDRSSHVNAINFVRVIAETLAAVLITVALSAIIENLWWTLLWAAVVMIFVTFVLVGASPRSLGLQHADVNIRVFAPFVRFLRIILGPVAAGLMRLGDRVMPGRGPGRIRDEQQLLSMVDQAAEQDLLEEEEQDLIHSVVDFGDTKIREVMVPRTDMITVDASATVSEAYELMLQSRHSRIPVSSGDSDDIAGIIYLRDVAAFNYRRGDESETVPITKVMKPAQFVPDLQLAGDLLRQMQQRANHLALAVDEYGGIAGLVTLEDLIEELLGEISDEHDREVPEIVDLGDGQFQVSARLDVDELGELFGRELEDDEVETVGGLVAKHLGRLAEEGDVVIVDGIELTVAQIERKRQRLVSAVARWVGLPEAGSEWMETGTGAIHVIRKAAEETQEGTLER